MTTMLPFILMAVDVKCKNKVLLVTCIEFVVVGLLHVTLSLEQSSQYIILLIRYLKSVLTY